MPEHFTNHTHIDVSYVSLYVRLSSHFSILWKVKAVNETIFCACSMCEHVRGACAHVHVCVPVHMYECSLCGPLLSVCVHIVC